MKNRMTSRSSWCGAACAVAWLVAACAELDQAPPLSATADATASDPARSDDRAPKSDGGVAIPDARVDHVAPNDVPAEVPDVAPIACAGLDGAQGTKVVDGNGLLGTQPALFDFSLGSALPVSEGTIAATGTGTFDASVRFASSGGTRDVSGVHRATSKLGSLANVFRPDDGPFAGHAYAPLYDGKLPPVRWTELAEQPPHALSFAAYLRVQAGEAELTDAHATWTTGTATRFVKRAHYTRYGAFVLHLVFDSDCQRDTYLFLAKRNTLDAIFPTNDDPVLVDYLVRSKASLRVLSMSLGAAAEMKAAIDASACATNRPSACRELVMSLTDVVAHVGDPSPPSSFVATPQGQDGWFAESFRTGAVDTLPR